MELFHYVVKIQPSDSKKKHGGKINRFPTFSKKCNKSTERNHQAGTGHRMNRRRQGFILWPGGLFFRRKIATFGGLNHH